MKICNGLELANRSQFASPIYKGKRNKTLYARLSRTQCEPPPQKKVHYILKFLVTKIKTLEWGKVAGMKRAYDLIWKVAQAYTLVHFNRPRPLFLLFPYLVFTSKL